MRRLRKFLLALAPVLALLIFADPALALTHGGEGIYGSTSNTTVTYTMFMFIGFFPIVIIVFSAYQMWGENRRHKKLEALRAARESEPDRSGW